jgi:lipid II:glycine glycyltransferase (peptidoglycan interpeptide bridge formation enzyme)
VSSDAGRELPGGARLLDVTDVAAAEWDRLAVESEHGHAFQSHAWGELKRPGGWDVRRFRVDRDGRPIAVFAMQVRAIGAAAARRAGALRGLLPRGLAAATYVYAPRGPILLGEGAADAKLALAGVRDAARRLRSAVVTVDPAWPVGAAEAGALAAAGFSPAPRDVQVSRTATLVPLFADEHEQHRLVRKSTANLVNRARREGAVVERIDLRTSAGTDEGARESALAEMHGLLEATARREGLVLRDREYQVAQWRDLGAAGHATLWFAGVDGRRWVGSVTLRCGSTLHQFQAGSADGVDLSDVPANHLLQWEIVRWAAGAGYRHYDMGGVDTLGARGLPQDERHPLWNLYVFKRGFGAEGVEYVRAHEHAANPLVGLAWRLARGVRA